MPKEGLTQNPQNPTYLGDGLYAEYDGYGINLYTQGGEGRTQSVYLEPEVYHALTKFVVRIKEANDGNRTVCTE